MLIATIYSLSDVIEQDLKLTYLVIFIAYELNAQYFLMGSIPREDTAAEEGKDQEEQAPTQGTGDQAVTQGNLY